jgi:hypothetical protein
MSAGVSGRFDLQGRLTAGAQDLFSGSGARARDARRAAAAVNIPVHRGRSRRKKSVNETTCAKSDITTPAHDPVMTIAESVANSIEKAITIAHGVWKKKRSGTTDRLIRQGDEIALPHPGLDRNEEAAGRRLKDRHGDHIPDAEFEVPRWVRSPNRPEMDCGPYSARVLNVPGLSFTSPYCGPFAVSRD